MDLTYPGMPLVLRQRQALSIDGLGEATYDESLDMWTLEGRPLIEERAVGQTSITCTSEGVDQTESAEQDYPPISEPKRPRSGSPRSKYLHRTYETKSSESIDQLESLGIDDN